MKLFKHHPDGSILIVNDEKKYEDVIENFIIDLGEEYHLPCGQILRSYQPDIQNYTSDGNNQIFLDNIWYKGDEYILSIDNLNQAKAIRNIPTPLIPLTKAQKLTILKAEYDPQILSIQTQIAIAVSTTKNTTTETAWRNSLTAIQAEFTTKRGAILNG